MASDQEVLQTELKKEEEAPIVEDSTAIKAEAEKSKKENETLKRELKRRQEEIDNLKKEKEKPVQQEVKVEAPDELATPEGWLKKINQIAEEKSNASFSKIREANLKKAKAQFLAKHPEYSANDQEAREKYSLIISRASALGLTDAVDDADMFEVLQDAWATVNRKELEAVANEQEKSRSRAQKIAAQAAGAGGQSDKMVDDFSESEREAADKSGISPERYRRASKMLAENSNDL